MGLGAQHSAGQGGSGFFGPPTAPVHAGSAAQGGAGQFSFLSFGHPKFLI